MCVPMPTDGLTWCVCEADPYALALSMLCVPMPTNGLTRCVCEADPHALVALSMCVHMPTDRQTLVCVRGRRTNLVCV